MSDEPQPGDHHDPEEGGSSSPVNPFGFDLSKIDLDQMMRMLGSEGPVNWEVAGQVAGFVAADGEEPDPPVGTDDRTQLDELVRAAETLVSGATGLPFAAPVRTLGPRAWAELHLGSLRPVLEALATTLQDAIDADGDLEDLGDLGDAPEAATAMGPLGFPMSPEALGGIVRMMAPVLLGVQSGSMIGYLAQHALGRYDLPLPTSDPPSVCFVVKNLDAFEHEWSLERADLRFAVALHEVARAAERSVSWVQERLVRLAIEYVSAYEMDPAALESRFGAIDPNDPESLARLTDHPEVLLGAMQSPRQAEILGRLQALTQVLEGYADTVVAQVGEPLIPSFDQIREAVARHRIDRGEAGRFIEGLLGLRLEREHYDQGLAFCTGVVERAGLEGLNRLWERETMLPTRPELEAPGLWLARIELELDGGSA